MVIYCLIVQVKVGKRQDNFKKKLHEYIYQNSYVQAIDIQHQGSITQNGQV